MDNYSPFPRVIRIKKTCSPIMQGWSSGDVDWKCDIMALDVAKIDFAGSIQGCNRNNVG